MKKNLFTLFLMILPILAKADAVEIDGIYYNLLVESQKASVTKNPNKYVGNITIPQTINYMGNQYIVTAIDQYAFWRCSDLYSVLLPNTIETIGSGAFGNSGLKEMNIPNSVTKIESSAFYGCI